MESHSEPTYWRKCTSCKTPIAFATQYWVCSVSTCNRVRTGLVFCSVSCFDAHVPVMNHKDAGAIEKRSPTLSAYLSEQEAGQAGQTEVRTATPSGEVKREVLLVVSKTKEYVRAKAGLNTSDTVMDVLSDKIRALIDDAIRRALQDERKTLLDRDFR